MRSSSRSSLFLNLVSVKLYREKSRFIKLGGWKLQQFSNILKWRTCNFQKYSLSKCNIFFHITSLFIVFLQNQGDKQSYKNIRISHAFISFSRNPWHAFAEAQGSEEPALKNTSLRKNVISLHLYIIYKILTLSPVYNYKYKYFVQQFAQWHSPLTLYL